MLHNVDLTCANHMVFAARLFCSEVLGGLYQIYACYLLLGSDGASVQPSRRSMEVLRALSIFNHRASFSYQIELLSHRRSVVYKKIIF
jgi:hypothetical protein